MTNSYKCPICGKINDLENEVTTYRCKACTRTVRAHGFESPVVAQIAEQSLEIQVEEQPKRAKKRSSKKAQ